jgi:hypothetical protein
MTSLTITVNKKHKCNVSFINFMSKVFTSICHSVFKNVLRVPYDHSEGRSALNDKIQSKKTRLLI